MSRGMTAFVPMCARVPNEKLSMPSEGQGLPLQHIVFVAEADPEGGFTARAIGASIVTQAEGLTGLWPAIRDAVRCHFGDAIAPSAIHIRLGTR
jgi:hypothetical protein